MTYSQYDVVVVPFPFSDSSEEKKRPAVVISDYKLFNTKACHSICLMITTSGSWPHDIQISDIKAAGLKSGIPSKIRMKMFTIDNSLIKSKIGKLSAKDQTSLSTTLRQIIP